MHLHEGASANKCAITLIPKLRSDRNPSSYKLFLAFAQNHVLLHPPQTPTTTVVKFVVHKCLNHLIHIGTYTSLLLQKQNNSKKGKTEI
jgi:hypothetical protein